MTPSVIFYFVVFLTVNAAPNTHKPKPTEIITDASIRSICPKTINPTFCQHILNKFKGKELFPKTLTTILENARIHAMKTAVNIRGQYTKIKDDKSQLKLRYHKCWENYENITETQIRKANHSMHGGNMKLSKIFITQAMKESRSCYSGLEKLRDVPSDVLKDIKEFQSFCSIILVMCDKLLPAKGGGGCTIMFI